MERLQQLENIEKEIAASIQNAGIDAFSFITLLALFLMGRVS